MNYQKGGLRLSLLLTVVVAVSTGIDSFSPSLFLLQSKDEYVALKEKILKEVSTNPCNTGQLSYFVEADTDKFGDFVIIAPPEKDGTVKAISKTCPSIKEFAVILGREYLDKNEIMGTNLTAEFVQKTLDSYSNNLRINGVLEKSKAVVMSILWLWLGLAFLLGLILSIRWVYKGFRN